MTDISHRSASVFSSIPYDLYCRSIQKVLSERICKTCGQYFASIVMLPNHIKTHKHQPSQTKLVRSVRVAARRQREMMVIIANAENMKSAEWKDKDRLDIIEIIRCAGLQPQAVMASISTTYFDRLVFNEVENTFLLNIC